jgi:hypothetical protein
VFAPLCFLKKTSQVFIFGEDRKSRSSDCFSVMTSLSTLRFDLTLAYDVFSILLVYIYIYIYINKIGRICKIYFSLAC